MNQCFVCECGKKFISSADKKTCPLCGGEMKQWMFTGDVQSDDAIRKIRMKHREAVGLD